MCPIYEGEKQNFLCLFRLPSPPMLGIGQTQPFLWGASATPNGEPPPRNIQEKTYPLRLTMRGNVYEYTHAEWTGGGGGASKPIFATPNMKPKSDCEVSFNAPIYIKDFAVERISIPNKFPFVLPVLKGLEVEAMDFGGMPFGKRVYSASPFFLHSGPYYDSADNKLDVVEYINHLFTMLMKRFVAENMMVLDGEEREYINLIWNPTWFRVIYDNVNNSFAFLFLDPSAKGMDGSASFRERYEQYGGVSGSEWGSIRISFSEIRMTNEERHFLGISGGDNLDYPLWNFVPTIYQYMPFGGCANLYTPYYNVKIRGLPTLLPTGPTRIPNMRGGRLPPESSMFQGLYPTVDNEDQSITISVVNTQRWDYGAMIDHSPVEFLYFPTQHTAPIWRLTAEIMDGTRVLNQSNMISTGGGGLDPGYMGEGGGGGGGESASMSTVRSGFHTPVSIDVVCTCLFR